MTAPPGSGGPPAPPASLTFQYLGHPQPAIDKRLLQAKNFLADEDPNRYLNFADKIKEIENYVALLDLPTSQKPVDTTLLKDVKVMLVAHRDWEKVQKVGGTYDIDPSAPVLQPFSNRLISTNTSRMINDARKEMGLDGQIRSDRDVFSHQAGPDFPEFLKQMQDDANQDPAFVDEDTSLPSIESRAYTWALNDPSLISSWMHPKGGILNKATGLLDEATSEEDGVQSFSTASSKRTARTWLPDYLKVREDRINELLRLVNPTSEEFDELENLLHFHENAELAVLHEAVVRLTLFEDWGYDITEKELNDASDLFGAAYNAWVAEFRVEGVQLMLQPQGSAMIQSKEPGVFYVEDGSLDVERQSTISRANNLLIEWRTGVNSMGIFDQADLDAFLEHSLPPGIVQLRRALRQNYQHNIIPRMSIVGMPDISVWGNRLNNALNARKEDLITAATIGIFHYIRPGEILDPDNDDLYLPWDCINALPLPPNQIAPLPQSHFPMSIKNIEQAINQGFQKGLGTGLEDGNTTLVLLLQQVTYPELRALLIPFLDLCSRESAGLLDPAETTILATLRVLVHNRWNAWIHGFIVSPGIKRVTVKLPLPTKMQQKENPRIIYCHDPDHVCNSDVGITSAAAIQTSLNVIATISGDEDRKTHRNANTERKTHLDRISDRFTMEHLYPGLATPFNSFRFDQYMISKQGLALQLEKFDPIGPNGDPTIVYYRGPLDTFSLMESQTLFQNRQDIIAAKETDVKWGEPGFGNTYFPIITKHLPDVMKEWCDSNAADGARAILDWFIFEIANPIQVPETQIVDFLPRGRTDDGEDGIDDADVIISQFEKYRAKLPRPAPPRPVRAASPAVPTPPAPIPVPPPTPPMEFDRSAVSGDLYTRPGFADPIYLGRLVRTIEVEINRLLREALDTPSTISPPQKSLSLPPANLLIFSPDTIHERLCSLLEQFMPKRVYENWTHYRMKNRGPAPTKEETLALIAIEEQYTREVVPWLRALVLPGPMGISIAVPNTPDSSDQGPGRFYQGERGVTTLHLQERAFLKTPTEEIIITITAPWVGDQNDYKDEALVAIAPVLTHNFRKTDGGLLILGGIPYTSPPVNAIVTSETEINTLLARRTGGGLLSWIDSERLLEHVRLIMPIALCDQEARLFALDSNARTSASLSPDQTAEFWDAWSKWTIAHDTWLNGLPGTIHIDRGDATDGNFPDSQRFLPNGPTIAPQRAARSFAIPRPVLTTVDEINVILQYPTHVADLSEATWMFLRTALRPLFREKTKAFREALPLDNPEHRVLNEVTTDIFYMHFLREILLASTPTSSPIGVSEPRPGQFELVYIGDVSLEDLTPTAEEMHFTLWHDPPAIFLGFQKHKQLFYDIAVKIRLGDPLSTSERLTVEEYFQPQLKYRDIIVDICEHVDTIVIAVRNGVDVSTLPNVMHIKTQFIKMETKLIWHRWLYDYQNLAAKFGERCHVIGPIENLLVRRLAGSTRDPSGPAVIPPPKQAEIKQVEIEVNNLLNREKKGTATPQELSELEYLLFALLPPKLRTWRSRLEFQEKKYLTLDGLDATDTLEFLGRETGFKSLWDEFKAAIPVYGILLTSNWYSYTAICELCSRARTWKENTQNSDGTFNYPATDDTIEDYSIRIWRHQANLLAKHVNTVWTDDLKKVFLWDSMPQELHYLKQYLQDQTAGIDLLPAPLDFTLTSNFLLRRNHFIVKYMEWFSTFSPNDIQALRDQAGAPTGGYDYSNLAERRGIQRAGLELALNFLATHQEQHRPSDRFRIVDIVGNQFVKPRKLIPMCLPLEPWKRPLEQEPFDYTTKVALYQQWRERDYELARNKVLENVVSKYEVPVNYKGPLALADGDTAKEGARRLQAQLAIVALKLQEAYLKAPRPLLQELLLRFSDGLDPVSRAPVRAELLADNVEISQKDLKLLLELAERSWDELKTEIPPLLEADRNEATIAERVSFDEFVPSIEDLGELIPYWIPCPKGPPDPMAPNRRFIQPRHDPTWNPATQGIAFESLINIVNTKRQESVPPLVAWTSIQIRNWLQQLDAARHLHFDTAPIGTDRVWRIPLTGHPENKYISRTPPNLPLDAGAFRMMPGGLRVITYNAQGLEGPPILLPHKFELLERIAYRVGRDCRLHLDYSLDEYQPTSGCLQEQFGLMGRVITGMNEITDAERAQQNPGTKPYDPKTYTLLNLALSILEVAPDLFVVSEIQWEFDNSTPKRVNTSEMTENEAGTILQLQMIEEVSNNWELRFPENEHVWDFADKRVKEVDVQRGNRTVKIKPPPMQFFNLKRFPLEYQTAELQALIIRSGPVVEEKEQALQPVQTTRTPVDPLAPLPKVNRHIRGQQPSFPFGETPYQVAFQSFRVEQNLKDVPEFQTVSEPRSGLSLPNWLKRKLPGNAELPPAKRFGLPDVPTNWTPDSISQLVKKAQVLDVLRRTPGQPDGNILEHYFTQAEIEGLTRQEAWDTHVQRVMIANQAVEDYTKKKMEQLTPMELKQARMALDIDLQLGTFRMPIPSPSPPPPPTPWVAPPQLLRPPRSPRTIPSTFLNMGAAHASRQPPPPPPLSPPHSLEGNKTKNGQKKGTKKTNKKNTGTNNANHTAQKTTGQNTTAPIIPAPGTNQAATTGSSGGIFAELFSRLSGRTRGGNAAKGNEATPAAGTPNAPLGVPNSALGAAGNAPRDTNAQGTQIRRRAGRVPPPAPLGGGPP